MTFIHFIIKQVICYSTTTTTNCSLSETRKLINLHVHVHQRNYPFPVLCFICCKESDGQNGEGGGVKVELLGWCNHDMNHRMWKFNFT